MTEAAKTSYAARATRYARDVVSGKIDACLYVRQACQRHLDDLEASKRKGYPFRFDREAADKICRFAENMVHVKGQWAKQKIKLEPWQIFLFAVAFGWLRKADSLRRYREIYWEIPRKNGKSLMGAVIGLYMAFADGEKAAEVYSGAASEHQAWKVFWQARRMALKNRAFKDHFSIHVGAKNLACLADGSRFEPIIGDPGDGDSPSCAIVDEYHEHKTAALYDTMKTGMGARNQPFRVIITTAGTDTSGPCYEKRDEAVKILSRAMQNDELFAIIYSIDEGTKEIPGDDWTDQKTWKKANPNWGVSVKEDFLEAQRKEAIAIASKQNINKCKHLNVWSAAGCAWINMVTWRKNARDIQMSEFEGEKCWIGVDLASKIDLTAMMFLFRRENTLYLFGKYYLPEDTIRLPENDHYQRWLAEGYLTSTPGARTDYRYLIDDLLEWNSDAARKCPKCGQEAVFKEEYGTGWRCDKEKDGCDTQYPADEAAIIEQEVRRKLLIQELAYDPKETEMLMQEIRGQVSFECVEITQSAAMLSEPMKEFEALYTSGGLLHDGNPMTTWQAANVVQKSSATKYYYPAKERKENKIDGIVAAIMALKRASAGEEPPSVYETRGLLVFGD